MTEYVFRFACTDGRSLLKRSTESAAVAEAADWNATIGFGRGDRLRLFRVEEAGETELRLPHRFVPIGDRSANLRTGRRA